MRFHDLINEAAFPRKPSPEILAKAAGEGFDTAKLWFHGSRKRFDHFRLSGQSNRIDELGPGVYLTSVKWLANTWARDRGFIAICVVRNGPLFDLAKVDEPHQRAMMRASFVKHSLANWFGKMPDDAAASSAQYFDELIQGNSRRITINHALDAAGYIGGFKRDSQIQGQIVVFDPKNVLVIARQGGHAYMTSDD